MIAVEKLANEGRFDYLLVERTRISQPVPVAQTCSFVSEDGDIDLSKFSNSDSTATVVDCLNFFKDFGTNELLVDHKLTDMEDDDRTNRNYQCNYFEQNRFG
jgi:G3E family GTPase